MNVTFYHQIILCYIIFAQLKDWHQAAGITGVQCCIPLKSVPFTAYHCWLADRPAETFINYLQRFFVKQVKKIKKQPA